MVDAAYFAMAASRSRAPRFTIATGRTPGVVIINEAMARRFWRTRRRWAGRSRTTVDRAGPADDAEIAGVVGRQHFGLDQASEPQMFVPHAQMPWPSMAIVIRTPLDAGRISGAVRRAVWIGDDTIPVPPLRRMTDAMAGAVGQPRFRAWLLGVFAATAILLAMTGLYGTMAYAAQQRSREIGLRIALGATPRQATAPLLRQGLTLIGIGTCLGLAGSVGLARALNALLYVVGARDPATFVGAPLMLAVVAALACYLPARQARRIDPIAAINADV